MCIDIYAPGLCIDVLFLLEQIWFERSKDGDEQAVITEVYDFRLSNPLGNPPLSSLLVLFPHDCTVKTRGKRTHQAQAWSLGPDVPKQLSRYDWPYYGDAKWVDTQHTRASRSVAVDPVHPYEPVKSFDGVVLTGRIGFPESLENKHLDLLADSRKSLLALDISPALGPGEEGWLRVVVKPVRFDHADARARALPGSKLAIIYDQRLAVTCPLIVRDRLSVGLRAKHVATESSEGDGGYQELERVLFTDGFAVPGTSTRIEDHRVALITCGDIDIMEGSCTDGVVSYGVVSLSEDLTALWWGGGSSRNRECDLVHNAERVIERLKHINRPDNRNEIARDLAPSGKYEAFATLLDNMIEASLLVETDGYNVSLPNDWEGQLPIRLAKLRSMYPSRAVQDGSAHSLMYDFRDLHPFMINFRLWWFASGLASRIRGGP